MKIETIIKRANAAATHIARLKRYPLPTTAKTANVVVGPTLLRNMPVINCR